MNYVQIINNHNLFLKFHFINIYDIYKSKCCEFIYIIHMSFIYKDLYYVHVLISTTDLYYQLKILSVFCYWTIKSQYNANPNNSSTKLLSTYETLSFPLRHISSTLDSLFIQEEYVLGNNPLIFLEIHKPFKDKSISNE